MDSNIFDKDIQHIHSFDAFYKNVIFRNNKLIIPYINLGISQHPLNSSDKLMFIDFAYLVFKDIFYLDVFIDGRRLKVINELNQNEKFHFGGTYLDIHESIYNDMEISCKDAYLQTLNNSQLSSEMWIPIKVPNYKKNIDDDTFFSFFQNKFIPSNITDLLF